MNKIWKTFGDAKSGNEFSALQGVSFSVQKGEFVAIMGASGSGKSTLLHILGCLDLPTRGRYRLNNVNILNMQASDLPKIRNEEIGFIFQDYSRAMVPALNVKNNICMPFLYSDCPKNEWAKKIRNVLKILDIEDKIKSKPSNLSGGEKQRVAIARAIVNDPSIILADEPTGNLDSKNSDEVMNIFRKLNENDKTIILVTHEDNIASYAKRKIVLRDGLIAREED